MAVLPHIQVLFLPTQERLTSHNKPARPGHMNTSTTFLKGEGSTGNTLLIAVDFMNQSTHLKKTNVRVPKLKTEYLPDKQIYKQSNIRVQPYWGP